MIRRAKTQLAKKMEEWRKQDQEEAIASQGAEASAEAPKDGEAQAEM